MRLKFRFVSLFLCLASSVYCQNPNEDAVKNVFGDQFRWIPSGFEVISTTPLPSIGALERCGEGTQRNLKICVPYHRCDVNTNTVVAESTQNTDGAGLIDIRAGANECESYLDVCCNLPGDGMIPTVAPTPAPTKPPIPPTPKASYCGIRNTNGLDFTITGNLLGEAQYGEFPWMLAILRTNYNPSVDESLAICGASLIAPQVALTGAHCVAQYQKSLGDIKVRAGEWDTLSEKERHPYQERSIKQIIVHNDFNPKSLANDYALLILDRPYSQAENIGTICLPPQGQLFDSRECFVMGWGKKQFGSKASYSNILKRIELPIVNHGQCQSELKTSRLGAHFSLHNNFICAGEKGKDACTGDGGSPLICPDPNNPSRYQQVGIVAWGIGCGDYPGVYADVTKGRQWIDDNMAALGFDQKPYTV